MFLNFILSSGQENLSFRGWGVEGYQLAHSDSQYIVPLVPPVKEVLLYASVFRGVHRLFVPCLCKSYMASFSKNIWNLCWAELLLFGNCVNLTKEDVGLLPDNIKCEDDSRKNSIGSSWSSVVHKAAGFAKMWIALMFLNFILSSGQENLSFRGWGVEGYQLAHSDSQYIVPLVPPVKEVLLYASVFRGVHRLFVPCLCKSYMASFSKNIWNLCWAELLLFGNCVNLTKEDVSLVKHVTLFG
jgi:hypothetical protein